MPGWPPKAATSSPESSARVSWPLQAAITRAFLMALSRYVRPSSTTSGACEQSVSGNRSTSSPDKILWISTSFPRFLVPTRSVRRKATPPNKVTLQRDQLVHTMRRQVQQLVQLLPRKRLMLGRPLDLDQPSSAGHD